MSQFSSAPGMPVVGGTNEQGSKTIREDLERSFRECLSLEKLQGNLFALLGSPYNIAIFVSYILISINSTLLIRNARGEDGTYPFHQTTVVIMVECVKICMASALYLKSHNWDVAAFKHALLNNKALFVKNAIPAILYGFYNNLTYFNLQNYDAAAFYILMQLKTALTGMMYKFAFKRNLSLIQWGTILSLTVGCSIKQFAEVGELDTDDAENKFFNRYLLTVLLQVFLGGLASVSIEYILKIDPDGSKGDLQLQNVFMYINSIVFNMIFIVANGDTMEVLSFSNISTCLSMRVLPIVFSYSMMGIITSIFLKNLDSLLKIFAVSVEIVLIAVMGWIIFGETVNFLTFVSIVLVALSIYVYAVNPVNKFDEGQKSTSKIIDLSNDADPENGGMEQ